MIKNHYSSLTKVMLLAAMCLIVLTQACKKPTEGIRVIVDSSILFPAPTVVKFANADSTSTNKPSNFTVSISGAGAKYVQMASGGTNFMASNGILSLALIRGANPSASNPISFTVTASLPNFAPVVKDITITKDALSVFNVKAFEYAKPAPGTTVLLQSTTLISGVIPATYNLTTAKTATMAEQATISFASGTQMQDANGTAITTGNLNLSIVQYGTGNTASVQALPGGTSTSNAVNTDGTPINGIVNFVTAGMIQMNLVAGSVDVKKFSKPVSVTIELNSKLDNFTTGNPIKVGDVIPYWSLNETTGQWKNEGITTVALDGNGRLSATIQITHLSCWSVGWTWGAIGAFGTCGSSLNVTINTSDASFKGGPYNVSLQAPDGTYLGGVQGITLFNGAMVTLTSLPSMPQAKIVVSGGTPFSSVQSSLFDPCGAGSVSVTLPVSAQNPVNANVDIVAICNGKDITVLPSATFEIYQQTGSTYTDAGTLQIVNGKGSTGLQVGKLYYLTTTYNNVDYTTNPFSVSQSDFNVPSPSMILNAKYDVASNTLNFTGSIAINCN